MRAWNGTPRRRITAERVHLDVAFVSAAVFQQPLHNRVVRSEAVGAPVFGGTGSNTATAALSGAFRRIFRPTFAPR